MPNLGRASLGRGFCFLSDRLMAGSVKENSGASGAFKLLCRTFPPRPTLRPRFPDPEGRFFTSFTGFLVSGTRPDGAGSESQPIDDYLAHSFKGPASFC